VNTNNAHRESLDPTIGGLYAFLGNHSALYVEAMGVTLSTEHVQSVGFKKIWLESDSTFLCQDFSSIDVVPWTLRGRWKRCMMYTTM